MRVRIADVEPLLRTLVHPEACDKRRRSVNDGLGAPDDFERLGKPSRLWSGLDRLLEYLERLDESGIDEADHNSCRVVVSGSFRRQSYCLYSQKEGGTIRLDLQPADDVASMIRTYATSQVWGARISYQIFAIIAELFYADRRFYAGDFVRSFIANRLRNLIDERRIAQPEPFDALCNTRLSGHFRSDLLRDELSVFLAFHELGHYHMRRHNSHVGFRMLPVEMLEMACDDYACHELSGFAEHFGEETGIFECVNVWSFLLLLIWTLADSLATLHETGERRVAFEILLQRSRVAAKRIAPMAHRTERDFDRLAKVAERYFPIFEDMLALIDVMFKEGLEEEGKRFTRVRSSRVRVERALWRNQLDGSSPEVQDGNEPAQSRARWEEVWESEDAFAKERIERLLANRPERRHSRMAYTQSGRNRS